MKTFLFAMLAVALAATLALLIARQSQEPELLFDGKLVSSWALQLNSPSAASRDEAEKEVRNFDTDAVPALVRMLRTPDPILAKPLRVTQPVLPRRLAHALARSVDPFQAPLKRASAAQALRLMGPKAGGALKDLAHALRGGGTASWHASLALSGLGSPGIDELSRSLAPSAGLSDSSLGFVCYALGTQGATASNAIPGLATLLQSGRPPVAEKAAAALATMGKWPVPQLLGALSNSDVHIKLLAIDTLAQIGPPAQDSASALNDLASNGPALVRNPAAEALVRIHRGH